MLFTLAHALPAWAASEALPGRPVAGEAVVVVGTVTATDSAGARALANGARVAEGTTLETASGGHVYLVTVDKGFISVRPNSSVTIERYRYDPAQPTRTEIKILLNRGVVRAISGTGAQAAKENYRMNTPVVALGIRGTDFSVFADAATTRAEVRRGGIVLTPFGADCSPGGSGPCEGPLATQLSSGDRNVLLQFRRGDIKPAALDESFSYLRPDRMEPPRRGEGPSGDAVPASGGSQGSVAPTELNPSQIVPGNPQTIQPGTGAPPAGQPSPPVTTTPPPPAASVYWGRWEAVGNGTSAKSLDEIWGANEHIGFLAPFAMGRTNGENLVMPVSGRFDFTLTQYEAYVKTVSGAGATYAQATLVDPKLSIDFGTRQFNTQLDVVAGGQSYNLHASGKVEADGRFANDQTWQSNGTVQGALGGENATKAGFIFQGSTDKPGVSTAGATSWSRPR
ncbi:FecR family protein [Cupriavidus necator]|uniref:FecR family protein n=1 Tax=Cupriavidus necator TaxID=106590 RepID=UPI0013DFDD7F|nr:FecR family protein [Cupriavidus necator]